MDTQLREKVIKPINGYGMLLLFILLLVGSVMVFAAEVPLAGALLMVLALIVARGIVVITPNTAKVMLLFGKYEGTVLQSGMFWVNPFYSRESVSMRARNFESEQIKVNDKMGNPVLISVITVWKVKDTFRALFEVDAYEKFVKIQTDSAVRKLAALYPYDHFEDERAGITLSTDFDEVNSTLERETSERLDIAGIMVVEARITHLSYAPEIASVMLRRQQASAVVAARSKIVEGAVGMVESALHLLSAKQIIDLDEEKKAAMVSNLMVVLCSDRDTQPIVNAGTLNH